jgi:hypothetical protein
MFFFSHLASPGSSQSKIQNLPNATNETINIEMQTLVKNVATRRTYDREISSFNGDPFVIGNPYPDG